MANCNGKSLADQIMLLMESQPSFSQRIKQRLVFDSNKVANHFNFIAGLMSKGVSDGLNDSGVIFGLKEAMVQFSIMIASSKEDDGAIGSLIETLEGTGNLAMISSLRTWIMEEFAIKLDADVSVPVMKGCCSEPAKDKDAQTALPETLEKPVKDANGLGSVGTKLIDTIMSHEGNDFIEKLEVHLVDKTSKIVNAEEFWSILVSLNVLQASGPEDLQARQRTEKAVKAACSKRAIGSLVSALQCSGNEHVIEEMLQWLETGQARQKNYPIAVKSLVDQRITTERKAVIPAFLKQAGPANEIQKVATLRFAPKTCAKGASALWLENEKMMASFDDGTVKLGNWITNELKNIKCGGQVKDITSFQFDEEIVVLGTAAGTFHLFDVTNLEEQWSLRLGSPVQSLKFTESTLVTFTRTPDCDHIWWIDISRSDMRLLNQRSMATWKCTLKKGFVVEPDYSYLYLQDTTRTLYVYSTKSGRSTKDDENRDCSLEAPAEVSTLKVVDLISTKRYAVAGCKNGAIAMWNICSFVEKQKPTKTFQGHSKAVVSLCVLKGHLLSLDVSGKLLMWSGYDLESKNISKPVPRVLAENSFHGTDLVAHERWFATGSTDGGILNIWTLPDLWLRTG